VTALVLAGGLGTRLAPVVADRPKPLAEVGGRPFISFVLEQLRDWGIEDVVVATGHLGEQIEQCLGTDYSGLRLTYSRESEPLGTGGALREAVRPIHSELVVVLNGDSYCATDFGAFLQWHHHRVAAATLLLVRSSHTARFGRVETEFDGRITGFLEKGPSAGEGWISAGIYLFNTDCVRALPPKVPLSLEVEVFPTWIGRDFFGYRAPGMLLDIGTPESYASAESFFLRAGASRR
jgi:NDP-sugar pyrophosphorylase family protein